MGSIAYEKNEYVSWLEDELLSIAQSVAPRVKEDAVDYAMIVSTIRRQFEAQENAYINLHAKIRGR